MRAFGATAEDVEAWSVLLASGEDEAFEVMPENWPAVTLFAACSSQWQVNMDKVVGLRYEGVEAVMRMRGVARRDQRFEQIRLMEAAALKVLNRRGT